MHSELKWACYPSPGCLLENLSDAVISTDLHFTILNFNKAAEQLYGIDKRDAIGTYLGELIHYKFINDTYANALTILQSKGIWSGKVIYQHPDGHEINLLSTVKYVIDHSNKRVGIVAVNKDISALTEEQDKRKLAEFQMKAILENSGQGLILLDGDFKILLYNQMAEQIHRETHLCSLTDRGNLISLLPPHRRKEVLSFFNRVRKGERLNYQVQYGKKWIEITLVPIAGKESCCEEICACLKDISYLKSAEQKRILLKQKHHNDLTNAFIEGQENERKQIGRELHDNINQVLAAIKLNISLAMAYPDFCQRGLELSHSNIIHAIDEIRKLSHQLLPPDFSNGSFIDSIEYLVQSFSLSFQVSLDVAHFSAGGCSDTIKLNLFRILQEQLNNIYKYANAENVNIKLSSLNNRIMLIIKDDGAGTDLKKKSKGVGLTNISNRVSSLNGQCTIWSKPNQGFRLSIQIPTGKQPVKRKRTLVLVNA